MSHPERARIELTPPQVVPATRGLLFNPEDDEGRAAVALAPGAGTDLMHPVLLEVGRGLAAAGHPALLFNFAFTEAGRKRPDPPARLESAFSDVTTWLRSRYGHDRRLVLGGRSMGARIASRLAAHGAECDGLVCLGYPLHPRAPAGARVPQSRLRTAHWPDLTVPVLFVQGDRDSLCDLELLERERHDRLSQAETSLHVVPGGDHSFGLRSRDARGQADVLAEVRDAVVDWTTHLQPVHVA